MQTFKRTSRTTVLGRGQPTTRTCLRVAAVVDARVLRRWQSVVLAELVRAEFCELTILTADRRRAAGGEQLPAPLFRRPRGRSCHLLYRLYERVDRRKFGFPGDPLSPASLDEIASASVRPLGAVGSPDVDLPRGALEAIRQQSFDVLLCLDASTDFRRLAPYARFGAWSFEVGENRLGPALFWETSAAKRDSVSGIHVASERYGERVVCRASTSADPVSVHRNQNATYVKAAHLLRRCLLAVHQHGWDAISSAPLADEPPSDARRPAPTNAQMLPFLWRVYWRRLRGRLRCHLFAGQWYVAYRRGVGLGGAEPSARRDIVGAPPCTVVRPPRGREYADPFVLRCGDRHFVFFEDYDRSIQRGAISYIEIDRHGRHSAPRRALEQDYHLSYPFVFRERENVYLLPETWSQRRIELYRATRFPCEWKRERVLIEDIPAADPTLLYHHGTFWLFTAVAPGGGPPLDELHLFYAKSLLGEWVPHPMNPVVADAGQARPAGKIFVRGGALIRPAQDCTRSYGRRVILNRIEVLDGAHYREIPVGSIDAVRTGFGGLKTHCYNADGDFEVFDGCRLQPKIWTPRISQRQASWALGRFRIVLSDQEDIDP